MDYAKARTAMVESQIRPADVTDPTLVAALRAIPRESFATPAVRAVAYADSELDLGHGRYLLRPRHLGKLLQALEPRPGERALELAGGTGYAAAVLGACGLSATMLEPVADFLPAAQAALEAAGRADVAVASTPLMEGWAQAAPYDVMVLNGAAEVVPEAWLAQLGEGGRLGVIVRQGVSGAARVYRRERGVVSFRTVFDANPPVLPELAAPRPFMF
jgi:protein-L-isoaspartate(D-aspartate) O-methyltransferase